MTWSLAASVAVHMCVAIGLVLIARHVTLDVQLPAETITVIFAPSAALEIAPPASDFAAKPIEPAQPESAQPSPAPPEPQPPIAQLPVPEPEPPPPVDVSPLPPPVAPVPPQTTLPKQVPHPLPPRPAPRPRTNPATPIAPMPSPTQTTPSQPSGAPANQPQPATINPGWQTALGAWLQANKTYPEEARRRGDEGRAMVRFTVSRDGRVLDFQVVSGTGSSILDAAVERLLRGARVPPFPAGMAQDQVTVTLQIRYTLEH